MAPKPPGKPAAIRLTPEHKARAARVQAGLLKLYPDARCALNHRNAFELLIATILSAQCTDVRVNIVTPALFKRFPDAAAFAKADVAEVESLIKSTGFYRNKAKSILGASKLIVEKFGHAVPRTMEELLELPGVARKTANVVLGNAYGKNVGFVVDTHIGRLSRRLGFTRQDDPVKVERDLIALFPGENWTMLAHLLIYHGRQVCFARNPQCDKCAIARDCPKLGVVTKK
ncbi:MAG: endonuclease III [Planctomycetota bacterium]|nr:endonuclease III [Planctomycetota bacterium]